MSLHDRGCDCPPCRERRHGQNVRAARFRQRVRDGLVAPPAAAAKRKTTPKLADVFDTPELPGAACVGRHHMFDPTEGGDPEVTDRLHAQAIELCGGRPALEPCRAWLLELPRHKRPRGVVAGFRITERGTIA